MFEQATMGVMVSQVMAPELYAVTSVWRTNSETYVGNMKPFLDDTMKGLNATWGNRRQQIEDLVDQLLRGVEMTSAIFGVDAGQKFKDGRFESALNRAVFEVQAYYFSFPKIRSAAAAKKKSLAAAFIELSSDADFITSIEATTKSIENYKSRLSPLQRVMHSDRSAQR